MYSIGKKFRQVSHHRRIDKFCFNNMNAGVSRSCNMGINLAEGDNGFWWMEVLHCVIKLEI